MIRVRLRPLDFRQLRYLIRPIDVLQLLGWRYSYHRGEQYRGGCPIHISTRPTNRIFSVTARVWYCWKCRRGGDAIRLYALTQKLTDLEAAHQLCERLGITKPYLH